MFQLTPLQRGDMTIDKDKKYIVSFNSRPYKGATQWWFRRCEAETFQLTPLQRGDMTFPQGHTYQGLFQLTPLQRGDISCGCPETSNNVSTHAPTKGRRCRSTSALSPKAFQLTPLQRGDRKSRIYGDILTRFNSRPYKGATRSISWLTRSTWSFNSRPYKGATIHPLLNVQFIKFQLTPLQRGDAVQTHPVPVVVSFNSRPYKGATHRFN